VHDKYTGPQSEKVQNDPQDESSAVSADALPSGSNGGTAVVLLLLLLPQLHACSTLHSTLEHPLPAATGRSSSSGKSPTEQHSIMLTWLVHLPHLEPLICSQAVLNLHGSSSSSSRQHTSNNTSWTLT